MRIDSIAQLALCDDVMIQLLVIARFVLRRIDDVMVMLVG